MNDDNIKRPKFASALHIAALISAPLVAVSKAGAEMQKGQTRALLDNCFTVNKFTGAYEPVMINMTMTRQVIEPSGTAGGAPVSRQVQLLFSLPLLSILPLSSLAIDNVDIDFSMEVTSVTSKANTKGIVQHQADLYGKISSAKNARRDDDDDDANKSTTNGNLKISLHASQLPLPKGVLTILDLYSKNIHPLNA